MPHSLSIAPPRGDRTLSMEATTTATASLKIGDKSFELHGETMIQFMREQGSMERPVEKLRQMEEEINAMVARVLESYGLTIEEYRERSPRVFADEAAANAFLEEHPDLKKRYEVLPLHQAGGRYGAP